MSANLQIPIEKIGAPQIVTGSLTVEKMAERHDNRTDHRWHLWRKGNSPYSIALTAQE